jgi:hypothetical protein
MRSLPPSSADRPSQPDSGNRVTSQVSTHDIVSCHECDDAEEVRKLMKARGFHQPEESGGKSGDTSARRRHWG